MTRTVKVQLDSWLAMGRDATVPPVRMTWFPFGKACREPPHALVGAGLDARVRPAGRLSVRLTPVKARHGPVVQDDRQCGKAALRDGVRAKAFVTSPEAIEMTFTEP